MVKWRGRGGVKPYVCSELILLVFSFGAKLLTKGGGSWGGISCSCLKKFGVGVFWVEGLGWAWKKKRRSATTIAPRKDSVANFCVRAVRAPRWRGSAGWSGCRCSLASGIWWGALDAGLRLSGWSGSIF